MTFNMRLSTVAVIIALAVFGGFALSVPRAREIKDISPTQTLATTTPTLTLRDVYKKGVHTISGSVTAPDACTTVSAVAAFASSTGPNILINLTMPPDTGRCLEMPTKIPFSVTVAAPSQVPIEVHVNGVHADTTNP